MNVTPLWVPLVVAGLGLLGTAIAGLGGVWLAQRRSDKREALIWEREQERERDHWAREDTARTFEERRSAYEEILSALRAYGIEINGLQPFPAGIVFSNLAGFDLVLKASDRVSLYGSPTVVRLTDGAVASCVLYGMQMTWGQDVETTMEVFDGTSVKVSKARAAGARKNSEEAFASLRTAIRDELGVPKDENQVPSP